jgi:IclR family KDG regulon transcriptional repressor
MDDSFTKGLRVLETLAAAERPLGLSQIAKECNLVKSHAHKFLRALIDSNYVQQPQERGPYRLTFKMWELGSRALARADLVSAARGPMQEITDATKETSTIAVYESGDAVYIYKVEGTFEVRTHTDVGRRRPAYCVAAGKTILAFQPDSVVDAVASSLKRLTNRTVTSPAKLRAQLAEIRKNGYAVNWGEWTPSVRGLATPIWNAEGQVIAALNLSIPAERLDQKAVLRLSPKAIFCALQISRNLGYTPAQLSETKATRPAHAAAKTIKHATKRKDRE